MVSYCSTAVAAVIVAVVEGVSVTSSQAAAVVVVD